MCDLSHANDASFWQTIEEFSVKVYATHSNCTKFCGYRSKSH
ncbi:hypothetical protein [Coxiella-like endosymbiont]